MNGRHTSPCSGSPQQKQTSKHNTIVSTNKNKKMVVYFKAYNSCVIPAPIEDVWPVIREFAAFLVWHPSFDGTCEMKDGTDPSKVGGIRTVKTKDGGVFVERL
jgi:hypothetical protein